MKPQKALRLILLSVLCLSLALLAPYVGYAKTDNLDHQAKKIYYRILSITQNSYYTPISSWDLYEGTLDGLHDYLGDESFSIDYPSKKKLLISFANGDKLSIRINRIKNNALYMVDSLSDIFDQLLITVPEDKKLETIYAAIDGMVSVLDPHSSYIKPDDFKKMRLQNRGKFSGIGVEITIKNKLLTIVSPFEGTPAFRAGLKARDTIVQIEDQTTRGMSLMDAAQKMRGPQGTLLNISVLRKGWETPKVFTLERATIPLDTIKPRMLSDSIAYVRITRFLNNSTRDMLKALLELDLRYNAKGLILDLRNNPGGLLDQAVNIADMFLQEGMIVFTKGRIQDRNMRFQAHVGKKKYTFPIIILVNEGSASGTEILAAALRDNNRGLIVGTRTFGKGSIQTIFPLRSGGAIRLTTAKFFTPNGTEIQEYGITPDFIVEIANEERAFQREEDLESAIEGNPEPIPPNVPSVLLEMLSEDDDPILNLATEMMTRHLQDQNVGYKKIFKQIMDEHLPTETSAPQVEQKKDKVADPVN